MCLVSSDSLRGIFFSRDVDVNGPVFFVILFFHTLCHLSSASLTVLDQLIGLRLEAFEMCYILVLKL